jgi:hypothetical protein
MSAQEGFGHKLHHRDVVHVALRRLAEDIQNGKEEEIRRTLLQTVETPPKEE